MKINTKLLKIADMIKDYDIILDDTVTIVDRNNELSAVVDDYSITYYRDGVYNYNGYMAVIDIDALMNLKMVAEALSDFDVSYSSCHCYKDGLCYGQKCTPKCYYNGDNSLCDVYDRK